MMRWAMDTGGGRRISSADCPLCSFTRPLVRNIMDWIKELLTDPMMIMLFDMFKGKVWELGQMTKQLFGFRLF